MTTKGLYFDGTKKQFARFDVWDGGLPVAGSDCTLEFWIRAPAWSEDIENYQRIIEFGAYMGVGLEVQQGKADLYFWERKDTGWTVMTVYVGTLPDDQWHFVAFTLSDTLSKAGGQLGVYLDGKSQGIFGIGPALSGQRLSTCYIGGSSQPGNWYFTGSVSGIRLWDRVRTASEISSDMTNPCTTSPDGLVASIPLDEGQGTSFAVKGASGNIIATGRIHDTAGHITNAPAWNQAVMTNLDPISEGIWFVIQNKADVATDLDIPARRLALTVDGHQPMMDVIPLQGNYDRFLWRAESNGDNFYRLVNKQGGSLVLSDPNDPLMSNRPDVRTLWFLTQANQATWGTNAYFIENVIGSLDKRVTYSKTGGVLLDTPTRNSELQQVWLLQPMEVALGYCIPSPADSSLCPFTKMLTSDEFGVTFYATATTSEWAILNAHLIIRNEINAIQSDRRANKPFDGWKVLIISGYDNTPKTVATYPMVKPIVDKFGIETITEVWGGTHPDFKTVLLTESMMCQKGVPYRKLDDEGKPDFRYREFEQVVHEFAHVIDLVVLNFESRNQPEAQKYKDDEKQEWFPSQVQYWLNSNQGAGAGLDRSHLSEAARQYLSTVFTVSNDWLPPRWLRDHVLETFELRCGDVLTQGQALHSRDLKLVLRVAENGNLAVYDAGGLKWGTFQHLGIALYRMQSVKMTKDGHLQFLDCSNRVLWTSPNEATPGARLIISNPGSSGSYLKIIDKSDKQVWPPGL